MSQTYEMTKDNKGKVDAALDFPRLTLKKGEVARLAIFGIKTIDGKPGLAVSVPEGGYYFGLRVPGADKEFVGSFECLASEEMKAADEYDADACAHCAAVLAGQVSEEVLQKRLRRFIMPVIRYKTQTTSSDLVVPNSVEAIAWKFTDRYFNALVDEHEKWAETQGLLGHDITLTCEAEKFQNFRVSVEPGAAYQQDKELGRLVIETFMSQTAMLENGLIRVLGSKLNNVDLDKKISETVQAAAQLGVGGPTATAIPSVDPETVSDLAADLMGATSTPAEESEATDDGSSEAVSVTPPVTSGESVDFDDFFGNK